MLIVVIIIGILASALIPRLSSARGKANDTARKADLQQIATALISYQLDKSKFPSTTGDKWTTLDIIKPQLTAGWLASLPKDTSNSTVFSGMEMWIAAEVWSWWNYLYTRIMKNWIPGGWFVLMAQTETEWGSNYVFCGQTVWVPADQYILNSSDFDNISICNSLTKTSSCSNSNWACTYSWSNQLRYIYKY